MSWAGTYSHNLLYSLDVSGAVAFFNQTDITISAMCRVVQGADTQQSVWQMRLASLKLYRWQIAVLRWLAPILDKIQTSHCEGARQADIARANRVLALLS
jgi:hypothetical protein